MLHFVLRVSALTYAGYSAMAAPALHKARIETGASCAHHYIIVYKNESLLHTCVEACADSPFQHIFQPCSVPWDPATGCTSGSYVNTLRQGIYPVLGAISDKCPNRYVTDPALPQIITPQCDNDTEFPCGRACNNLSRYCPATHQINVTMTVKTSSAVSYQPQVALGKSPWAF